MDVTNLPQPAMMDDASTASPELQAGAKPSIESAAKPTSALTPPTSEEMNHNEKKQEAEDSELSDLDLDDEDEEEIEPDHYWDGGRIPVFKPTMDQFRSFKKFVEKIDKYGMKSGIVKVIPPPEWRQSLPTLDDYVKRIKIKNPISQEFNGTQGVYTQQNVEKQRSYNLPEWKAVTQETQHQPPAKRGERRRNQEKVVRGGGNIRTRGAPPVQPESEETPTPKRGPGRPRRHPLPPPPVEDPESEDESKDNGSRGPSRPATPATKPPPSKPRGRGRPPGSKNGTGAGQTKSVTSRRLNNITETADYIDEKAFKNFKYGLDDIDEFTAERCNELETHYWKSLGFNQPMYAADMPGSLFDSTVTSWNVAELGDLLGVLGTKVPGVNTAYLYMGMWKATFAWHLEDVDLYSINYIHFGAPKQWYSISQEDARKFEKAMKSVWPVDAKNCDQFLRHKTYLISPDVLQKQYGVKVNKLVHYEGEFVITFPYGYHSGYNIGYNCAESVNFATESWLDYGKIARKCNCEKDNVWVDVYEIERKLRGEPTPEYIEETDDESDMDGEDGNLPSPPASVKGKPATKKRKRGPKQEEPKKKKKIRIRIRVPTREPCVMCPNDNPWEPLLPTDNGKKVHRSCALFTPETWIAKEDGKEKVYGVTTIDKARLDLKCNFCRSKRGACFQCSSKKCTRAFHATCALAAGVQIDGGMVPTFGEDGTEYFEEGYDFRCKYHRPKQPKNLTIESLEGSKRLANYGRELKYNDVVQAQPIGGDMFAGLVVENRPGELSLLVDVLPEGNRIEIEYKFLCLLDPDDSQRPKPSSNAIPMPEGMNKKAVSINNRQDGVPSQDQPFHDNPDFKWHDFYNIDMPPPGYLRVKFQIPMKLKVDVEKPDQLYFYLGEPSTDAKCFFTDKAGSKEIVVKANFIERMQPKTVSVHQYQGAKQQIAAAVPKKPANVGAVDIRPQMKPYVYKPRDPSQAGSFMWSVDQQSLANQRTFLTEATPARSGAPNLTMYQSPQYAFQEHHFMPLKPFPNDQYYSSKTLPAAHEKYSGFQTAARRESQGAQTMSRPNSSYVPNYKSVRQQQTQLKQSQGAAPIAPMAGGSAVGSSASPTALAMPLHPYAHNGSRPSSSSNAHYSPYGAPITPATMDSHFSALKDGPPTDEEYLANLRKYPYLLKAYCRKPKIYESPYPPGGGYSMAYQPVRSSHLDLEPSSRTSHTPHGSVSSVMDIDRATNQPWTPPSQVWDRSGLSHAGTPPPHPQQGQVPAQTHLQQDAATARYPQPTYSTPAEFQRQIQSMPSTASRDGAHARMLRDQGYTSYSPHWYQRNSFGQPYDQQAQQMYNSPKAPTPSPLSDPNTPGQRQPWGSLSRNESVQDGHQAAGGGFGHTFPPVQGADESWR